MEVNLNPKETFKVKWKHYHNQKGIRDGTQCTITQEDGITTVASARTLLHPKDQFCYADGRKESLKRVLLQCTNFSQEERKVFWDTYFKHFPIKKEKYGREMATK